MSEELKLSGKYTLEADSELRIQKKGGTVKLYVTLISGSAEILGAELIKDKKYELMIAVHKTICTSCGCVLHVEFLDDEIEAIYISKESTMSQYRNYHKNLEEKRMDAEKKDKRGPIAMVVGVGGTGKTTFCRIILNLAGRSARTPLYVNINVGRGAIPIAGVIGTSVVERFGIEGGFWKEGSPMYHFGCITPKSDYNLFRTLTKKVAKTTLESMNAKKTVKYSGVVINTCGWVEEAGYNHLIEIAKVFGVDTIFVSDEEPLYQKLLKDVPSFMKVVLLPKVWCTFPDNRIVARNWKINKYFYGPNLSLTPFSFMIKFADLKLYGINSCKPLKGEKKKTKKSNEVQLNAINPTPALIHHVLNISDAESTEDDVLGTPLVGIVFVSEVNMKQKFIKVISPKLCFVPNKLVLYSKVKVINDRN
ncbi:protein CLP1 homolog [Glossina fuscipes]|uniref:Protein CLP1 homolog n=1 Tax=Glossina fuscipes TaxID=7396 RepID=A0A9C6E348_9MUSC|nr:protein CLP1 homolog [Glossina fuscipes]